MQVYKLDIKWGFGQIDIKTYKGEVTPKKQDSGFDMDIKKPDISISTSYPEIDIDLSRCRSEMGYSSMPELARRFRDEGLQAALDYIQSKAAEGDTLAALEKGVTIQDVAFNAAFPEPPDFNVDMIPKSPPQINVKEGRVEIDLIYGSVKVYAKPSFLSIDFKPARVEISMEKNPYISIKAVPVGKDVNIKV
jgi:AraC-like DNA-binding protein